ncbi:hypothetical protein NPIL_104711 [Nephila pilipes]|uniref:GATA-type domain-containing protein n=1 Tax=Nephila pilipes TaxID=299642 RepID=A0A8X6UVL6_NEPPI|nr:hypothetical protein NPIL_104711 [Nephila pilipes]
MSTEDGERSGRPKEPVSKEKDRQCRKCKTLTTSKWRLTKCESKTMCNACYQSDRRGKSIWHLDPSAKSSNLRLGPLDDIGDHHQSKSVPALEQLGHHQDQSK